MGVNDPLAHVDAITENIQPHAHSHAHGHSHSHAHGAGHDHEQKAIFVKSLKEDEFGTNDSHESSHDHLDEEFKNQE